MTENTDHTDDPTEAVDREDGGQSATPETVEPDETTEPDETIEPNEAVDPGDTNDIGEKMDRIREIVTRLEAGDVSLERAKELRDEGKRLLADVEDDLDLGEASVLERE